MKTKLLKKIRKRYSITRIDSIANNTDYVWKKYSQNIGFPLYYVMDDHNDYYNEGFRTYKESYEYLLKLIKNSYYKYSTHGENKSEKVWWNNNLK